MKFPDIARTRENHDAFRRQQAGLDPVPDAQRRRDYTIREALKIQHPADWQARAARMRLSDPVTGLRPREDGTS